jgi:hypothetical protein
MSAGKIVGIPGTKAFVLLQRDLRRFSFCSSLSG